jgi:predicted ATPase
VIVLVGEPGIGKSALCQRLATEITAQHGMPLFGHCYEAGSPALPYQPFVEALTA